MFFDDILVYSPNLASHCQHLSQVFRLMSINSLFAKRSKCSVTTNKVEYLGHILLGKGVETDPMKIKAAVLIGLLPWLLNS